MPELVPRTGFCQGVFCPGAHLFWGHNPLVTALGIYALANAQAKAGTFLKAFDGNALPYHNALHVSKLQLHIPGQNPRQVKGPPPVFAKQ